MSSPAKPKKVGGEYGEVRASIDVGRLEMYVDANVKVMKTPLEVKQFKVRFLFEFLGRRLVFIARNETLSLDR